MEQEIRNLDSIAAAEAAKEAQKNSWTTWLLSPLVKKAEETEEETARKDRRRQERKIEKDMKERRLVLKKADLQKEEDRSRNAKEEFNAADLEDDRKIRVIQARISYRETRERLEREKAEREREQAERERVAKLWKQAQEQREKQKREAAEALRKQQAEERAAEQKRQEEETRKWQKLVNDQTRRFQEQYAHLNQPEESTRQASTSTCRHDGWWPKVQGRTACPECHEVWTYLLQCPHCEMKACPRCQSVIRPRWPRNAARTNRPAPSRVRIPSPDFSYDYD